MGLLDTIKREYTYITSVQGTLKKVGAFAPDDKLSQASEFEDIVDRYRSNVAIRFEDQLFTYGELDARASQYAHWGLQNGLQVGDCVALFLDNQPDYIAFWFGMAKIGVITALINNNLQGPGLAHCVNIANARALIFGPDQIENIASAREHLEGDLKFWIIGGETEGASSMDALFADLPTDRPDSAIRAEMRASDLCLYVYTSGTTGLPKAAKLSQMRTLGMMRSFIVSCRITERDRVYITLPLYHGTGGLCGIGQALMSGATIILRKKFSASAFWEDAVKHKATAFVYIGELCRYLMNTPEHPLERSHTIRKGFGNGLRAEVWSRFVERFNIPHLVEFYGSTEGNVSFMNYDGKIGAVGRLPSYMRKKIGSRIVKFDVAEEKPIRGKDGFCIETDPNEVGEAIGQITEDPRQRFDGYNDKAQTEKKILRDVFVTGDMWFRTGDLMKMDENAYIYFVDRIGDTFRWKAENVSTNEVAEAIATFDGIELPNVYGVEMPDTDGRAGMAAVNLVPGKQLNLRALAEHVDKSLPAYARPIFIRIQPVAETTGTFKYRKVELVKQGFDIEAYDDPVFVRLPGADAYVPMTSDILDDIEEGSVKF